MMQATRKRQHRPGRELAGVREGRSPRRSRGRHETGRRYPKAISTNLCHKGTTEEDMDTISVRKNSENTKECSETRQLEDITVNDNNATEKAFPWLLEFNKIVCSSRGNRNYQHLKQLLLLYTQKVLSVETSNVNLKNNINNILIFFHLYWLDIKQEAADHSLYLNKMSALLSVYIDMELKTSRQEIDLKILAALCIYLNNSEEHIFRVLIRIKHMTEKYTQICNHIFTKSLTNLKIKHQDKTSLNDVAYIRYLLAFKMWKEMEKISDKNEIDKLALELLGPRMPKLRDELIKFVPSPTNPMDQKNETQWLLNIDLQQMHEHFLLFEDQMDKHSLEDKIIDIIDLTADDEISVHSEIKREQPERNLVCSQIEGIKSREESVTIPLSKMCQDDTVDQHSFKQEIPINPNCNTTQKSYVSYWETIPVGKHIIYNIIYNFPNVEEYITKLDCIEDMEKIFNSIGLTKKLLSYTDNDITRMKIQDTLHMFDDNEIDIKSPNCTNLNMLSDRDEYVYVTTNHVGERVMAKSTEKIMQYLDNSDICTQNVNLDNKRKYDHGHGSKYSEITIKAQQGRNDCDTSNETSNDRLHLFKRNKFNTVSVDMDSKDDISFSHQIEIWEILENVSNKTMEFLRSPKQSPFELDNTNTLLSEKDILCNNQNNAINSHVNPIAFHLNTDNTFL